MAAARDNGPLSAPGLLLHPDDSKEGSQPAPVGCSGCDKKTSEQLCAEKELSPWKKRDEHTGLAVVTRPTVKCLKIPEVLVNLSAKSTNDCLFTYS